MTSHDATGKFLHCSTPALQVNPPKEAVALNSVHFSHLEKNGLMAPTSAVELQGSAGAFYKLWELLPMLGVHTFWFAV